MSGASRARAEELLGRRRSRWRRSASLVAQVARELARVDVGDADDAVAREVGVERLLRAPVRRDGLASRTTKPATRGRVVHRLGVLGVDADVAHLGRRHRDDLPAVRGVGEDLLVAGHRGREDGLAGRRRRARRRGGPRRRCRRRGRASAVLLRRVGHVGLLSARDRSWTMRPSQTVISTRPSHRRAQRRACSCSSSAGAPGRSSSAPSGSTSTRSARAPSRMRGAVEPDDARRRGGERVDEARERERALARRARAGAARTARGRSSRAPPRRARSPSRATPWGAWSVAMQSMVPSASARAQRLDVLGLAQRRVHLAGGVVAEQRLVGEQEVVRRHLGGDGDAARLRLAQDAHRAQRRDVRDVVAGARRTRRAGRRARR